MRGYRTNGLKPTNRQYVLIRPCVPNLGTFNVPSTLHLYFHTKVLESNLSCIKGGLLVQKPTIPGFRPRLLAPSLANFWLYDNICNNCRNHDICAIQYFVALPEIHTYPHGLHKEK